MEVGEPDRSRGESGAAGMLVLRQFRYVTYLNLTGRGFEARVYEGPIFGYLEERSRETGIPFLNMLGGFRAGAGRPLFLSRDGHWNRDGHRLAADLIVAELRRRSWLE